jgi:hypothetical protein
VPKIDANLTVVVSELTMAASTPPKTVQASLLDLVESCHANAPDSPELSLLRAGTLLNAFDWHGQQAWLLGNENQLRAALTALDQMGNAVLSFSTAEQSEAIRESLRSIHGKLDTHVSSENHLNVRESKNAEMECIVYDGPSDLSNILADERRQFLSRFAEMVHSLKDTVTAVLNESQKEVLLFGRDISQGERPSPEICHNVFEGPQRLSSETATPESMFSESRRFDGPYSATSVKQEHYLGNTVIEPGKLLRPGEWLDGIKVCWLKMRPIFAATSAASSPHLQQLASTKLIEVAERTPPPAPIPHLQQFASAFDSLLHAKIAATPEKHYEISAGSCTITINADSSKRTIHRNGFPSLEFATKIKQFEFFCAFLINLPMPSQVSDIMSHVWPGQRQSKKARNRFDTTLSKVNRLLAKIKIEITREASGTYLPRAVEVPPPSAKKPVKKPPSRPKTS